MGKIEIEVDVDDVIDGLNDKELIKELKERHLYNPPINYRSICDLLGMSYHTPIDYLLGSLSVELKKQKV